MSERDKSPKSKDFWPFSLETYRRDGVESACLALQDDYGLDVNCLLFCCWAAACGRGVLSGDERAAMVEVSRSWNVDVVQPLRRVRRALKEKLGARDGPEAALRQSVKDLELEAEWHEQRLLSALLSRPPDEPASRGAANENVAGYLTEVGCRRDDRLERLLQVLLDASFR